MATFSRRITRRLFLSLPAIAPLATLRWPGSDEHHFSYDHVIGTIAGFGRVDIERRGRPAGDSRDARGDSPTHLDSQYARSSQRKSAGSTRRETRPRLLRSLMSYRRTTTGRSGPGASCLFGLAARTRRSPLTDYREDLDQIQMTFAAPGHRTIVTVNRAERTANVEGESRGLLGKKERQKSIPVDLTSRRDRWIRDAAQWCSNRTAGRRASPGPPASAAGSHPIARM
jgi:hypothetical protein